MEASGGAKWKELRKSDPEAAARLQRSWKKKKNRARKQLAKKEANGVVSLEGLPDAVDVSESETTDFVIPSELVYCFELGTSVVVSALEQRIQSVTQLLRQARGLPEVDQTHDDDTSDAHGSSTESEGDDQDELDEKSVSQETSLEQCINEFAEVFKRHQALGERSLKRSAQVDNDDSMLEDSERLRLRLEEEVTAGKQSDPDVSGAKVKRDTIKLSKKKIKELTRPPVSDLKMVRVTDGFSNLALGQSCMRPDTVEVWDATAPDPWSLVWLKAYRNTVKVPAHWNQKRKYLSGKRAIEKPPFKLPEYVEQTKIGEIRAAILERESQKSLKQKQREKSRPKSNRMHVDFQTLHDAFFKYATVPELTPFGELYFEGKEREEKTRQFKPGHLSSKLKEALSIVLASTPLPWLLTMQRYGPPPSYPNLKIPGLNAPLPAGAQWGFHAGGWGKPPSDQFGNPLYPEVFADPICIPQIPAPEDLGPPQYWGELVEGPLDEEDEDQVEEEEDEEASSTANPEEEEKIVSPPTPDVTMGDAAPPPAPSMWAPNPVFAEGPFKRLEPIPGSAALGLFMSNDQGSTSNINRALPGGLTPTLGTMTPMRGLGGFITPTHLLGAGLGTPSSLSSSVPPHEFSSEGIKQQLREHEVAERKAKEVTGEDEDRKRRSGEDAKKKKKKAFKF